MDLAVILKTLGDDCRLRILGLLLQRELCVCDIESVLGLSQANASRHLSKMKSSGILSSRKTAQWVYYNIDNRFSELHPEFVESLKAEFKKNSVFKKDNVKLKTLKKNSEGLKC